MPFVMPLLGGNLSTETGTLNDKIQALQAARIGGILDASSEDYTVPAPPSAWTAPAGWPSITAELNFQSVLYFIGCRGTNMGTTESTPTSTWNTLLGLGVDGAVPTQVQSAGAPTLASSASPTDVSSITWFNVIQNITPGPHTYTLYVQSTGTGTPSPATYLTSPFLILYPF